MATLWIDQPVQIEIDGDGVKITLSSGDDRQQYRMSRNSMRHIVERGRRLLDAAEAKDRTTIIKMRGQLKQPA
jgi:hypothetical protein